MVYNPPTTINSDPLLSRTYILFVSNVAFYFDGSALSKAVFTIKVVYILKAVCIKLNKVNPEIDNVLRN